MRSVHTEHGLSNGTLFQSFKTRPDEIDHVMRCEKDRAEEFVEEEGWHVALGGHVDGDVRGGR